MEKVVKGCGKFVRSYFGTRDLKGEFAKGRVWLAFCDGEPAGFAYCAPLVREPVATLHDVGTLPKYRGRGVAAELIKQSSLGRPLRLVVDPANEDAVLYYLKHGLTLDYPQPVPTRSGKSLVWRMSGEWNG